MRGSRLLVWFRRLPSWLRILGLATFAHGIVLHPILTSLAFEVDIFRQPDDFGPEDFPLPPGTPLIPPQDSVDLGALSALCLTMLATTFGAGAVVVTVRRRSPGSSPP